MLDQPVEGLLFMARKGSHSTERTGPPNTGQTCLEASAGSRPQSASLEPLAFLRHVSSLFGPYTLSNNILKDLVASMGEHPESHTEGAGVSGRMVWEV